MTESSPASRSTTTILQVINPHPFLSTFASGSICASLQMVLESVLLLVTFPNQQQFSPFQGFIMANKFSYMHGHKLSGVISFMWYPGAGKSISFQRPLTFTLDRTEELIEQGCYRVLNFTVKLIFLLFHIIKRFDINDIAAVARAILLWMCVNDFPSDDIDNPRYLKE